MTVRLSSKIGRLGQACGYAAIAIMIVLTFLQFRQDERGRRMLPAPSALTDPLAGMLARCQAIGMAAANDPSCKAAWAENRRRFFTYQPTDSNPSTVPAKRAPAVDPVGH